MGLFFAYDGSTGADWVSHYAVRLASHHSSNKLQLLYVKDRQFAAADVAANVERIKCECDRAAVACEFTSHVLHRDVAKTLLKIVPAGPDTYLLCGTRVRSGRRGLLSGTVSARLLCARHCNVLALRVLQPGLLGLPRRLLLPLSGHPRGLVSGLPFLRLFQPDISHIHILYVARVGRWRFRTLSHEASERLRRPGEAYCQRIEQQIGEQLVLEPTLVDAQVVVSDDVPKEIVIAANKTKSRLICLGASERNRNERFWFGNPIEQVLRSATCDVAIYRGFE